MENSTSPTETTYNNPTESTKTIDSSEESGWTQYIDAFDEYNKNKMMEDDEQEMSGSLSSGSDVVTASMVSDAGSNPEWKQKLLNGLPKFANKLNFKMKRTHDISNDDSLEDTASSPVHSPKITMNFKSMTLHSRHSSDDPGNNNMIIEGDNSMEHPTKYKYSSNAQEEVEINTVEFSELKKRGLCLVPISMAINNFH